MFTPSTIGLEFKNSIRKLTEFGAVIEIAGVYFDRRGPAYGEVYYDKLKDWDTNESITLLVPKDKKALLTDGQGYKLRCLSKYKLSCERSVELLLNVEEIIDKEIGVDPRKQETIRKKCEILNAFHLRTQDNLSLILKSEIKKKRLPAIALIQPLKNDTLDDIKAGLGEYWDKYLFQDFPVNIHKEKEIIKTLEMIDAQGRFNLLALFRGGGETDHLSVFESTALGEAIIRLRTPIVTAIGHAGDEPLIQRIANRSFITPNDFGNYLKETYVNSGREDDLCERETELKFFQNALNEKSDSLQNKDKNLVEQTNLLQNQENILRNKIEELNRTAKEIDRKTQESLEIQKQFELGKIKNRKITEPINNFV